MTTDRKLIIHQDEFEELCATIESVGLVAFDTEFISEHLYQPELCLLQYNVDGFCVAVDPFKVNDLTSWWKIMTNEQTTVIVHGGQAEVRFCLHAKAGPPQNLIDVQIAEGLYTPSYPMGYGNLVQRVMNQRIAHHQTRTNWRQRPLTQDQIHYALEDVLHLPEIWNRQQHFLKKQNRLSWAESEFHAMVNRLTQDQSVEVNWVRMQGLHKLSRRELAIARELILWREAKAQQRNKQPKAVLRDDLIIDIAKHKPKSKQELTSSRELQQRRYQTVLKDITGAVQRGLSVPENALPPSLKGRKASEHPNEAILTKLLSLALGNRCAKLQVSQQLIGNNKDIQQLVHHFLRKSSENMEPHLLTGWRGEVCGNLFTDMLEGNVVIQVSNPHADDPLDFCTLDSLLSSNSPTDSK